MNQIAVRLALVLAGILAGFLSACNHVQAEAQPQSMPISAPGGLAGTYLAAPHKDKPAQVLILAGSGPTDRDGNGPLGLKSDAYKLLAQGLSAAGIASTRVDKRGMFGSAAGAVDANSVFIGQLAQDAHLWAKEIRAKTGAPCVWLLGHSEGGLVALQAAQDPTDICGIILVASPGRKASDILREQLRANPANAAILADALKTIDALEANQNVDVGPLHPALQGLFATAIQGFWKSMFQVNPTALIANYAGPVLIVQGTTDLQVTLTDARALAAAQSRATLFEVEGVNHILKRASSDRAENLATYNKPELPVAPEIIAKIASFINRT
jgi:uncharacterized protein